MKLSEPNFRQVVRYAPLLALDLLLVDSADSVLLGWRRNPPACDYLFVPGGRVYKDEPLAAALRRISTAELGVALDAADAKLHGVYEHFYSDNAFGEAGLTTHYVVIACAFAPSAAEFRTDDQHRTFVRLARTALLAHPRVHPYTRNYFSEPRPSGWPASAPPRHRG